MDKVALRALMAKRIGGIPVMAIVAVVAGAILYYVYKKRNSSSVAGNTDTTDTSGDVATGDAGPGDSTQQPVFQAVTSVSSDPDTSNDTSSDTTSDTSNDTTSTSVTTNAEWQREAINWLITTQKVSVDLATSAITKYLNGQALTADEKAARDKAVTNFGIPPQSISSDTVASSTHPSNAPASKQGEPPLNHVVKGTRDNTPSELARLYYGTNSTDATNKIKAANDTKTVPYAVGTRVHIPENYEPKYFTATAHINTVYDIARRNSTTPDRIQALNPHLNFPVKSGTRVRVK